MKGLVTCPYTATPCYPPAGRPIVSGWDALAASLRPNTSLVAIDGPVVAGWPDLVSGLGQALEQRGLEAGFMEMRRWLLPWGRIQELTSSYELRDDPDFDYLASGQLSDSGPSAFAPGGEGGGRARGLRPGASLVPHDVLWYADLPKRYAEAAVVSGVGLNVGQPAGNGPGTTKRLFFIDWPLLDRHRDEIVSRGRVLGRYARCQFTRNSRWRHHAGDAGGTGHPSFPHPANVQHDAMGRSLGATDTRAKPGVGEYCAWLRTDRAGGRRSDRSGGRPAQVRVAVPARRGRAPRRTPGGKACTGCSGTSFPVRFDYLDTVDGGNLSVHCHPQPGLHEFSFRVALYPTRVLLRNGRGRIASEVFLGLRDDADVEAFYLEASKADDEGTPLEITRYVPTFPATPHQLFLIPGGTPHGSGKGNVVLEISATPYLYSLRFYDWLRQGIDGELRPVHVNHAFKNLDTGGAERRWPATWSRSHVFSVPGGRLARGVAWRLAGNVLRGPAHCPAAGRRGRRCHRRTLPRPERGRR